jgi:hypothetical protein
VQSQQYAQARAKVCQELSSVGSRFLPLGRPGFGRRAHGAVAMRLVRDGSRDRCGWDSGFALVHDEHAARVRLRTLARNGTMLAFGP